MAEMVSPAAKRPWMSLISASEMLLGRPASFPEKGVPGYGANRPPNPECRECWGRGEGTPIIHDTRELENGAAMMYAGMKITKEGINVAMHSPFEALQLIGRHL